MIHVIVMMILIIPRSSILYSTIYMEVIIPCILGVFSKDFQELAVQL